MSAKASLERWAVRATLAFVVLGLSGFACVTHEQPRPTCSTLADGGPEPIAPPPDSGYQGVPTTDAEALSATGIESDPGPNCTNCQQGAGFELMPIADFEQAFAPAWFNFAEPGTKLAPQPVGSAPSLDPEAGLATPPAPYWGLQVVDLRTLAGGARCGSHYALHLQGGRFASWGGGFATQYATVRGAPAVERYCPSDLESGPETGWALAPAAVGDTCAFWMTPVEASQPARLGLDVSMFEGIAFWARRGPGGQAPIRVAVQDNNTSEGLALAVERDLYRVAQGATSALGIPEPACRRIKSCCVECSEVERDVLLYDDVAGQEVPAGIGQTIEKRCSPGLREPPLLRESEEGDFQYFDPSAGSNAAWQSVGDHGEAYEAALDAYEREIPLCCPKTMAEDPANGDPQFGGKSCSDYVFHYDFSSGRYCYDPGDPPLPEKNQNRCGDGFETTVNIDTEWRLFRIPWSELRRATLGRRAIDTRGIWEFDLYFGAGWLDTYVDDAGFYRKQP